VSARIEGAFLMGLVDSYVRRLTREANPDRLAFEITRELDWFFGNQPGGVIEACAARIASNMRAHGAECSWDKEEHGGKPEAEEG
jgi:hypothetical protein